MSGVSRTGTFRIISCAAVIAATIVASSGCGVEVGAAYPDGYDDGYPPDTYIATTEPVYFEGHAAYWYGGRWNYREGGRWNHYGREPAGLYQRRMQSPPRQRAYESRPMGHPGGRPAGHPEGRRGGGRR